ncbi:MAG: right-handed parallel beta-helix repeat-containing protein [Cyclobacteriaceae bacterium]|nr:right-handed parallel beta-helix repeat-containing protein [Cyclobacteriaceae bacterium]
MRLYYILLLFLFACQHDSELQFYVSANGSDEQDGKTPKTAWRSLEKVNQMMDNIPSGATISFRSGDTFKGNLRITKDSLSINAYGEGDNPEFTGVDRIRGEWTKYNDKIYQLQLSEKPENIQGLIRNGVKMTLGRFPDQDAPQKGYFRYELFRNDTLTDVQFKDTTDWVGAEVAVRHVRWRMYRHKVVQQYENKLILFPNRQYGDIQTLGYYFINSPKVLKREGEWAFDSQMGAIYLFTDTDPNQDTFTMPSTEKVIEVKDCQRVSIKDITISFASERNISIENSSHVRIENLKLVDGGGVAVFVQKSPYCVISNSTIHRMNFAGIVTDDDKENISHSLLIQNNDIREIGVFDALFTDGSPNYRFCGIMVRADSCIIENNRIVHTGYIGIRALGANLLIRRNYIDGVNDYLDDGGCIYVNGGMSKADGTIIEENIVTNAFGAPAGGPTLWGKPHTASNGIYIDDKTSGVTVRNNIVAHISHNGIFYKGNANDTVSNCRIEGNLIFNCERDMLFHGKFQNRDHAFAGATFTNNQIWNTNREIPYNSEANTAFHWKVNDEPCLEMRSTITARLLDIDEFSNNIIITSPKNDPCIMWQHQMISLAELEQKLNASGNKMKVLTEEELSGAQLFFNAGTEIKEVALPADQKFQDYQGNIYSGKMKLEPFTGKVLIVN